jgi:hypothetical protein
MLNEELLDIAISHVRKRFWGFGPALSRITEGDWAQMPVLFSPLRNEDFYAQLKMYSHGEPPVSSVIDI